MGAFERIAASVALLSIPVAWRDLLELDPFAGRPSGLDDTLGFFFEPGSSSPLLVACATAWLLARRAGRIRAAWGAPPAWAGGGLCLAVAAALCVWSHHARAPALLVPSLSAALLGAGLWQGGAPLFRALLFPALFLLLATPIPTELLHQIVYPLQIFTAELTARALELLGLAAVARGDRILQGSVGFQVIETCSGMRALTTLLGVSLVYRELLDRAPLRSALLVAATPLLAFVANLLRVLAIVLRPHAGLAESHAWQGLAMVVVGVLLLVALDVGLGFLLPQPRRPSPEPPHPVRPMRAASTLALTVALVSLAAITLRVEPWPDPEPRFTPLAELPLRLGEWSAADLELDRMFLGSVVFSEFVYRRYERGGERLELLVAADDRANERTSVLSPKMAPLASGWDVVERGQEVLAGDRHAERFRLRSVDAEALVYRWRAGCGSIAEETLRSALALDRSPWRRAGRAIVVRLSAPIDPGPDAEAAARARLRDFARSVDAALVPILAGDARS